MNDASDLLGHILSRRSVSSLMEPGPTREQLRSLLLASSAVPDHGLLRPFRFIVVEGQGRARFGDALAAAAAEYAPNMPQAKLDGMRSKAFRSPALIALIFSPKPGKIPAWEQAATVACAGYAIVLAAHALGLGAVWKSVPFTKGHALMQSLGMSDEEEMLGWIHLGTPAEGEKSAPRPSLPLHEFATILTKNSSAPWSD